MKITIKKILVLTLPVCGALLGASKASAIQGTVAGATAYANLDPFPWIVSTNPAIDSLLFSASGDTTVYFGLDLDYRQPNFQLWADVTFGSRTDPQRTTNLYGGKTDPQTGGVLAYQGYQYNLRLKDVALNNTDLITQNNIIFFGPDNNLDLYDSGIQLSSADMTAISTAPMTITALSGYNYLRYMDGLFDPQSLLLKVDPGATLDFQASGKLNTSTDSLKMYFSSPVSADINNGTLLFSSTNAKINSTSNFKLRNNSTLQLKDYDTKVEFKNLDLEDSAIVLGNITDLLITDELKIEDSVIGFNSTSTLTASKITTQGSISISGNPYQSTISSNVLDMSNVSDPTAFAMDTISGGSFGAILMGAGSSINIEDTTLLVTDGLFVSDNAQINIGDQGYFKLGHRVGFDQNNSVDLDITASGTLEIYGTWNPGIASNIKNNGDIVVYNDYFAAEGLVDGAGRIIVLENSVFEVRSAQNQLLTLTTDNSLNFASATDPRGGIYRTTINVDGGVAQTQLISYGAGDINLSELREFNVSTFQPLTADELDGKQFTIIAAQNSSVAGKLTVGTLPLVEDTAIPALIDFQVVDLNTNSKPDLTLVAVKNTPASLVAHPTVSTPNQVSSVNLLANAHTSVASTALNNALSQLTNAQVDTHLDSIHAEPYASYMTVGLETADQIMSTVLWHASSQGLFSYGENGFENKQPDGDRFWMDVVHTDGRVDSQTGLGNFNYTTSNLVVGQDLKRTNEMTFGAFLGFGNQTMSEHDTANQTFNTDLVNAGLYYNKAWPEDSWDLSAVTGFAYGSSSTSRQAQLGNLNETAKGSYSSYMMYVGALASYDLYKNDWVTLSPGIGASYTYYHQEAFNETNAPVLGLSVASASAQSAVTSLQLNAQFKSVSEVNKIHPILFVRYERDWYANQNSKHEVEAALNVNPGFQQTFVGQNRGQNWVHLGAGISSDPANNFQINGGLMYSVSSYGSEWGAGLNFRYTW